MNKYAAKLDKLRCARAWTVYKLSMESGVPDSTLHKWFDTETAPSIAGLEKCCDALGISLAQFFAEGNLIEATDEVKALYDKWCSLTKDEKDAIKAIIKMKRP